MLVDFNGTNDRDNRPKGDFEPIPEGFRSEAQVFNAKLEKSETPEGTKTYLEVEVVLLGDHEYANRHVWTRCYLHQGANFLLKDLLIATGAYNPNSNKQQDFQVSMVMGHQIEVVIKAKEYNGKTYNSVKYFNKSRVKPPKAGAATQTQSVATSGLSI